MIASSRVKLLMTWCLRNIFPLTLFIYFEALKENSENSATMSEYDQRILSRLTKQTKARNISRPDG